MIMPEPRDFEAGFAGLLGELKGTTVDLSIMCRNETVAPRVLASLQASFDQREVDAVGETHMNEVYFSQMVLQTDEAVNCCLQSLRNLRVHFSTVTVCPPTDEPVEFEARAA